MGTNRAVDENKPRNISDLKISYQKALSYDQIMT